MSVDKLYNDYTISKSEAFENGSSDEVLERISNRKQRAWIFFDVLSSELTIKELDPKGTFALVTVINDEKKNPVHSVALSKYGRTVTRYDPHGADPYDLNRHPKDYEGYYSTIIFDSAMKRASIKLWGRVDYVVNDDGPQSLSKDNYCALWTAAFIANMSYHDVKKAIYWSMLLPY